MNSPVPQYFRPVAPPHPRGPDAWRNALDESRRGEFGRGHDLLDRVERLAAGAGRRPPWPAPRWDARNPSKSRRSQGRNPLRRPQKGAMDRDSQRRRGGPRAVPEHPPSHRAPRRGSRSPRSPRRQRRFRDAACGPQQTATPVEDHGTEATAAAAEPSAKDASDPIVWLSPVTRRARGPAPPSAVRPLVRAAEPGPRVVPPLARLGWRLSRLPRRPRRPRPRRAR